MKKLFRYNSYLLAGLLLMGGSFLTACDDDDTTVVANTPFEVKSNSVSVAWDETEAVVDFSADQNWTATCPASWVSLTPEKGDNGVQRLFMTLGHNTYRFPREAVITIKCGENASTITVTQAGCTDEGTITPATASVEIPAMDYAAAEIDLTSYRDLIEANMGVSFNDFLKGIDEDGTYAMTIYDAEGNAQACGDAENRGTAGSRLGSWLDEDLKVAGWTGEYPTNALFVETWVDTEANTGTINIGRAPGVPENAEYEVVLDITNPANGGKITFKATAVCLVYNPVVEVTPEGKVANVYMEIMGADWAATTIPVADLLGILGEQLGIDEAGYVEGVTAEDRDASPLVLYMIDQSNGAWDTESAYTANGLGYWLNDAFLPTGWSGDGYPANTLYVEFHDDGVCLGRSVAVPAGEYKVSFVLALRNATTKYVQFDVTVNCL